LIISALKVMNVLLKVKH